MTEHPTSFERPQPGVDPTDPRGALLRSPEPPSAQGVEAATALPVQARSGDPTPDAAPVVQGSSTTGRTGNHKDMGMNPAGTGPEHSQPAAAEQDTHRPRPVPEGVPVQPGAEDDRPQSGVGGDERRTGQGVVPGGPRPCGETATDCASWARPPAGSPAVSTWTRS